MEIKGSVKGMDINMKKNTKGYAVYIGVMLLLVIVAVLLPEISFHIQDRYRMVNTKVEKKDEIVFSQMNTGYETKMYDRMKSYASMDMANINVAAIEYDFQEKAEVQEMVERILSQEWFAILNNVTMNYFYVGFEKGDRNLADCKKYIVYGNDYQQGIALMVWYLDIYVNENNARMQILVDAETDSIYYITITASDEIMYDAEDRKTGAIAYGISENEEMYFMVDQLAGYMYFYNSYYEGKGKEAGEKAYMDEQKCMLEYPFYYGDSSLNFEFQAEYKDGNYPDVSMGISEIENIIPEMIQN